MVFTITLTKRHGRAQSSAFTLIEVLVASTLGLLVCLTIVLLSIFSSRTFVSIANYVHMDQRSQLALDKMSREIRQAKRLTEFSAQSLTFDDADYRPLRFIFDAKARTLSRVSEGVTNTYLSDCDSVEFSKYVGIPISNTFDAYEPSYVTNTRLIRVRWICSRKILGATMNTESVQSAKIALRNY
jgi:hypothetical protein